jgi:hypothetical protein
MKLIAFAGKAGAGKDAAAMRLITRHQYALYKFAQPIKVGLAAMFGLDWEQLEGSEKETEIEWLGKSPRQLMQTLGTEWGRQCVADDVWLRVAEMQWKRLVADRLFDGLAISDCRFENEAAWVRSQGGTVVHLRRDGIDAVAAHASESGLAVLPGDIEVNNNGSLQDLHAHVDFLAGGDAQRV